jgi:hypothetical protein
VRTFGGIVAGVLVLAALEAALSSGQAANRVGGLFTSTAAIFSHLLDPSVPLVPDLANSDNGGDNTPTAAAAPAINYDTPTKAKPRPAGGGTDTSTDQGTGPVLST